MWNILMYTNYLFFFVSIRSPRWQPWQNKFNIKHWGKYQLLFFSETFEQLTASFACTFLCWSESKMAITIGQRFAIGLWGTCIAIRFSLNICGLAWWQRVRRSIFITLYFCSLSHFTFQFSSKSHVQLEPNLVGMTIGWFSTKFCLFLFI